MSVRTFWWLAFVLVGLPFAANADTSPQAAPVVRAMENRYHNAKTLKAIFLERYSNARNSLQAESGTVYFSRPGRMRWEYESPETKLFVADGKTVWFFVPADHTVTKAPMKESADWRTPLALLTGKAKLSSLCDRIDLAAAPATPGHVVLRCLPRGEGKLADSAAAQAANGDASLSGPEQPFDQVLLEVDGSTGNWRTFECSNPAAWNWSFASAIGAKTFRWRSLFFTSKRPPAWPS